MSRKTGTKYRQRDREDISPGVVFIKLAYAQFEPKNLRTPLFTPWL